ncbi:MAG: FAD/NAD(P)-binding protein [Bacteroidia bacterium]|nr:FAD/NAD(P)-binding protein [Bacteroidia bacterium]
MSNLNNYDIAFIGSGIATSFTLLNLIDRLESVEKSKPLKIALIEKNSDFHAGIPYGNRSTVTCLLITSLVDFLPQPELDEFILWLNKNKEWLLEEFKKEGGTLSSEWLKKHKDQLDANEWNDLFIPRRFFGWYISEKVNQRLEDAVKNGHLEIDTINSLVFDIKKQDKSYEIIGDDLAITTKKVVLGIGSLPPRIIEQDIHSSADDDLLVVSDPYGIGLDKTLQNIEEFLNKRGEKDANVLIIGANASALEMLYKLNDERNLENKIQKFAFLSTLGMIPDSKISEEGLRTFKPINLLSLKEKKELTAKQIADATYKDLDNAEQKGIGAATTVKIISNAFGDLLDYLSKKELENFACQYGNDIGRRQRCAGQHYTGTIKMLKGNKRFEHIKGRYSGLVKKGNGEFHLKYLSTSTKNEEEYKDNVNILINCIGSMNLESDDIPTLHKNLITSGLCRSNDSKIGFAVNQDFETAKNFHVAGPLLAGNVIQGKALWHLEHCGRIIWSSKVLSQTLSDYFYAN